MRRTIIIYILLCACVVYCISECTDFSCIKKSALLNTLHLHFRLCIFPLQIICSNLNAIAQFLCCSFLFRGWLSVVSQHRRGKRGRLITFDSHKWNANGLWNHIKVPDGCEWCQTTRAWFACHRVTFRPFSVPILTGIDVYTGWQGGSEKWKEGEKEHSKPWGEKRRKREAADEDWLIMKTETERRSRGETRAVTEV